MKIGELIAKRTRELLTQKNMTQYRLAKTMAIHQNTMTNIMNAKNNTINLKTVMLICFGLDMTIDEFFNDPIFRSKDIEID